MGGGECRTFLRVGDGERGEAGDNGAGKKGTEINTVEFSTRD